MVADIWSEEGLSEFGLRFKKALAHRFGKDALTRRLGKREAKLRIFVAKRYEISSEQVRKYFRGDEKPREKRGIDIAKDLRVRFEWFYAGNGEMLQEAPLSQGTPRHLGDRIAKYWALVPEDVQCAISVILRHAAPDIDRRKNVSENYSPERRDQKIGVPPGLTAY